ncbi:lipase family protein [Nitrosomonas supralitoralis]|uniref:Lipase n=1 Tax=Nitrosomonas supralitoralis TaxID=2116706 RepID=A0A2P7NXD8_9PROT|nr:lipase [Nitrosomonas supralitoralis]PSJ18128.1 lipase [Nitrosomonas supralitoralis]
MKKWYLNLVRLISAAGLILAVSAVNALPDECVNLTAPVTFIESNGLVCLQKIIVTDSSGDQLYKALLQWQGADNPNRFILLSTEFDDDSESHSPTFSLLNGVLTLPKVNVPKLYGTERYAVSLNWVTDGDDATVDAVSVFELNSVALYNNPEYVPNVTWKPYGMLFPNERRAVDLLVRSIPYAQLADAIYDFDNVAVGSWELIESNGKSSGMDAGVFMNRDTSELALVFRGTETCSFPCSFKELEDTARDAIADAAIGTGTVSDQFKDAFRFAQDVVNRHPGAKITVAGHSLGGGLAQAIGAVLGLETFAFNSSPVPDHFFDTYTISLTKEQLQDLIYVIVDIHDPFSNTDKTGKIYLNSHHVTPLIQFDFKSREILPNRQADLKDLRLGRHSIDQLAENAIKLMTIYRDGW